MKTNYKINEVLDYLEIDVLNWNVFFTSLSTQLRTKLINTYKIDSQTYDSSILKNIINSDTASDLTVDYFFEKSNEKYISPVFRKLVKRYKDGLIANLNTLFSKLSEMVIDSYAFKWWKLTDAITTNYKPLENYDMEEQRNVATDVNVHQTTETGIYGFNSTESNPTATGNGDNHTTGLKAGNEEVLSRHGNIGVTTSQQMLESEIILREKHNLLEMLFNDIDSILCLKVY